MHSGKGSRTYERRVRGFEPAARADLQGGQQTCPCLGQPLAPAFKADKAHTHTQSPSAAGAEGIALRDPNLGPSKGPPPCRCSRAKEGAEQASKQANTAHNNTNNTTWQSNKNTNRRRAPAFDATGSQAAVSLSPYYTARSAVDRHCCPAAPPPLPLPLHSRLPLPHPAAQLLQADP